MTEQSLSLSLNPKKDPTKHPIRQAIDKCLYRVLDIRTAARRFVPIAAQMHVNALQNVIDALSTAVSNLERNDKQTRTATIRHLFETHAIKRRIECSELQSVVEKGLFLTLFSTFDAYTGDLIAALFRQRPELFSRLNGSVSFGDVLNAPSIEALKQQVLDSEIESLRRKSYKEQFDSLSQRFGIKLTDFPSWPNFIEAGQRRNLLTHCDGVVSDQYIRMCHEAGLPTEDLPRVGEPVKLGGKYFLAVADLIIEVAVKLGQTLWRKTVPAEIDKADRHLDNLIFDSLYTKAHQRALMLCSFAVGLQRLSSDKIRKVIIINYAQALKRTNDFTGMRNLLGTVDWTAAATEFRLAEAVLTEDYSRAGQLMQSIGRNSDFIREEEYVTWPLFLEFRETEEFAAAYNKVFGYAFVDKVIKDATNRSESTAQQLSEARSHDATEIDSGDEIIASKHEELANDLDNIAPNEHA